jgi:uncharacterized protein (DUF697 family)
MALPLDIRDMLTSGAKLRAEREKPVRLAVLVDVGAPDELVDSVREALRPRTGQAHLHVEAVAPGDVLEVEPSADAVVALVGSGSTLAPSIAGTRARFIPTVVVSLEYDRDGVSRRLDHPILDTLVAEKGADAVEKLGRWLGDRVTGKRIALASNFGFVRRAVAEEAVRATAFQNGVIGGVAFIPGADMPLMTANQAKMVMQIAAAYGQELGAERIKEIASVVGGAFLFRTVARQFVGLLPGFGWAIKAGIGYSGTLGMGYAAVEYFEGGGDMKGLGEKLRQARDNAVERARVAGSRRKLAADTRSAEAEMSSAAQMPLALEPADAGHELPAAGSTEL